MINPIFVGYFDELPNGEIIVRFKQDSQANLKEHRKKLKANKLVKVVISSLTKKKIRSAEQNNYYWGIVIKILAEHFGYIGPGEKEDLHNELRSIFLVRIGRLGHRVVESTTKLSTDLFERYLEAIRGWALIEHNCKIPKPNEAEETDTYIEI